MKGSGLARVRTASAALKAARCRCIAACPSADSPTSRSRRNIRRSMSATSTDLKTDAKVGPDELVASGLIRKVAKHGLRVLGDGKLDRALHVSAHYFTESREGENCQSWRHRRGDHSVIEAVQKFSTFRICESAFCSCLRCWPCIALARTFPRPVSMRRHWKISSQQNAGTVFGFHGHDVRRKLPQADDICSRDHAVHHGIDHSAVVDGGVAVPGKAVQGRRSRAAARSRPIRAI